MAKVHHQEKAQLIRLDPKFLTIVMAIWGIFKFFFRLISSTVFFFRKLIFKVEAPQSRQLNTSAAPSVKLANTAKEDTFLNYGGIRWYCTQTHRALKANNLKSNQQGTAITFGKNEISVFGDLYEEQIVNIENALDSIMAELKINEVFIKEVHILPHLGKYLDKNGVPDMDIIGFTPDEDCSCLIHAEAAMDDNLCRKYFFKIISEEFNRKTANDKSRETLWNQSTGIKERLVHNREYHQTDNRRKYGALRGKAIIDIDAPIADGVYLSAPAREAVYVNSASELLNEIYKTMLSDIRKIKHGLGIGFEEIVLETAFKIVQKIFVHHSPDAVLRLRQSNRLLTDEEIALDFFVRNETGDAEHASLLLAFLLEKLNKEQANYLSGKVSIDRNWVPGGGHAWVRYTHSTGNIYILDPIKAYFGRLDNYSKKRWPYERKADLASPRIARPV